MTLVDNIKERLSGFLSSGLSPGKMALTVALGGTIGILPVPWGSTILCAAAAVVFRLNHAGIQVVNYLAYPLQIALFLPFYRLGERLFPVDSPSHHAGVGQAGLPGAFSHLGAGMLKGVMAWLLTAPFVMSVLYAVFVALFRRKYPPVAANQAIPGHSLRDPAESKSA